MIDNSHKFKKCGSCKKDKNLQNDFYKNRAKSDGFSGICKKCSSKFNAKSYIKRPLKYNKPRIPKEGYRWCNFCKKELLIENSFYKNSTKGPRYKCISCCAEYHTKKAAEDPLYIRRKSFRQRYKISLEEIIDLLKSQNNLCKICKNIVLYIKEKGNRWAVVDHDHLTGKIRGIICNKCNSALGFFEDKIENLKSAIQYLEK
jgi:hypothetical protein